MVVLIRASDSVLGLTRSLRPTKQTGCKLDLRQNNPLHSNILHKMLTAIQEAIIQLLPLEAADDDIFANEDFDVLRAVINFLDDAPNSTVDLPKPPLSDAGSSSQSDSEPIPEFTTSSSGKVTKRRARHDTFPCAINRSRMRRRHELLSLRQQVIALEEKLAVLQRGDRCNAEANEKKFEQLRVAAWQLVAQSQREQLDAAEKERNCLRYLIKDCRLSLRRVDGFVQKLSIPRALRSDLSMASTNIRVTDGLEGFEEISRNLPTMYMQIDGVFGGSRYGTLEGDVRDIRVQNEKTQNMSIELFESRLLPFSVQTAANAVWLFHKIKATKVSAGLEEEFEEKENILRRSFVVMLNMPNHKAKAHGRMETQRYVEHERVVILQCAVLNRIERVRGTIPDCFGMRQFQWIVIGPPRSERLRQSGRPVSQIETFEVTIPFLDTPEESCDLLQDLTGLREFGEQALDFMQNLERQTVENLLVNASANAARLV